MGAAPQEFRDSARKLLVHTATTTGLSSALPSSPTREIRAAKPSRSYLPGTYPVPTQTRQPTWQGGAQSAEPFVFSLFPVFSVFSLVPQGHFPFPSPHHTRNNASRRLVFGRESGGDQAAVFPGSRED